MAGFGSADEGLAREHDKDLSPIPRDLEAYAHVEGLVGEENELLEEAEDGPQGGAPRAASRDHTGARSRLGDAAPDAPNDAPSQVPDSSAPPRALATPLLLRCDGVRGARSCCRVVGKPTVWRRYG